MRSVLRYLAFVAACLAACPFVYAQKPQRADRVDHAQLLFFQQSNGELKPVRNADDWAIRRRQILEGMQRAMGDLPDRSKLPPLDVKIVDRTSCDGYDRLSLTYASDGDRVPALLLLPKPSINGSGKKLPAMLALHQTTDVGKREAAGEAGNPDLPYAKELAQRGYVVLAPDYPSFGDYACDFKNNPHPSGTMKGVLNHMRGVDLLAARSEVDPDRIGVIGHSLGGHNAMFVGAFDLRLKVVVSSCGWDPFHHYMRGNLKGWDQDRYMPRVRELYGNDPNRMPFDFYEVVAALAPRAFFSNSPLRDENFDVAGVKKAEAKAREVFALLGAADRFQVRYPDCAHSFPPEVRREAYQFIDRVLRHTR